MGIPVHEQTMQMAIEVAASPSQRRSMRKRWDPAKPRAYWNVCNTFAIGQPSVVSRSSCASGTSRRSPTTASPRATRCRSPTWSTPARGSSITIPQRSVPPCSMPNRWGSIRRTRWCKTRAVMGSRCARRASTNPRPRPPSSRAPRRTKGQRCASVSNTSAVSVRSRRTHRCRSSLCLDGRFRAAHQRVVAHPRIVRHRRRFDASTSSFRGARDAMPLVGRCSRAIEARSPRRHRHRQRSPSLPDMSSREWPWPTSGHPGASDGHPRARARPTRRDGRGGGGRPTHVQTRTRARAGVVRHRQRPATAGGTTFLNLEDENRLINVGSRQVVGCVTARWLGARSPDHPRTGTSQRRGGQHHGRAHPRARSRGAVA